MSRGGNIVPLAFFVLSGYNNSRRFKVRFALMIEYEVLLEEINPCGGAQHSIKSFLTVETDSPEAYVRENGRFPIMEVSKNIDGDIVITTGDGKGYMIRYTFTE